MRATRIIPVLISGAFLLALAIESAFAQVSVFPNGLNFSVIEVGQTSAPQTIKVENTSGAAVAITTLEAAVSPYTLVGTNCPILPVTLQPFEECGFTYTFSPSSQGTFPESLDVGWQAGPGNSGTVQLNLTGQGVEPTLVILPGSGALNFGDVDTGQTSPVLTFTLDNGSTPDVNVSSIQHPGLPFLHVGGTCPTPPFTLTSVQSCTLDYQFAPTQVGLQSDNVLVFANIPAGSVNLTVLGNGISTAVPELSITPVLVDFGLVQVGLVTSAIDVIFENIGTATLNVSVMDSVVAPFFILTNGCGGTPFDLAPGDSCQISYTFAPVSDGVATQVVSLASNDPSPAGHAITLTGQAEHSLIDVVPPLTNFFQVPVGQTPVLPMDVINPGSHFDVMVFGPNGLGPLPPEFDIQPGTCAAFPVTLAPGAGCQLLVSFTPVSAGPASHSNMLNHDASAGGGSYTLAGEGIDDEVFVDRFEF